MDQRLFPSLRSRITSYNVCYTKLVRFSGYRPQFYFRTTDITGTITLPAGVDMVKPGDNTKIIGELIHPIAMAKGLKLAVREGGRTVASGQVTA